MRKKATDSDKYHANKSNCSKGVRVSRGKYIKKEEAKGTLHVRKCPLRHFKEFVMMVGYDEFVVNRINYGGNYNEIII